MKRTAWAGLILSVALTGPAMALDEEWLVFGGDGGGFGYDRLSVVTSPAGVVTVRHGLFTAESQTINGGLYIGQLGEMFIDCKARLVHTGATTYYGLGGEMQAVAAPPAPKPAPLGTGNPRALIADLVCDDKKKGVDPHLVVGRGAAVDRMKAVARQAHVAVGAGKGWTMATFTPAALIAVDTSAARRVGDIATQPEITWMRRDQTTNGQAWRYNQVTAEYDCAAKARRGTGQLQIYAADNKLVHQEPVTNAAWAPLPPGSPALAMLEIACNGKKLVGLPVGPREAMIARLRELAVLM